MGEGGYVLITQPQATQQARGVGGGRGRGGEAGEQQIRALGNPVPLSPRLLLRCVSCGGSIKNSALGSAVQYLSLLFSHQK